MWIILILILIGLIIPIVAMVVDGYLRGKRADVLRAAVEQKLVGLDELKSLLSDDRRPDPLINYKAGLVLLTIGCVFVLWGVGELIALKINPQVMKLPGLRVGLVHPQSNNYLSSNEPKIFASKPIKTELEPIPDNKNPELPQVSEPKSTSKTQTALSSTAQQDKTTNQPLETNNNQETKPKRLRDQLLEKRATTTSGVEPKGFGFGREQRLQKEKLLNLNSDKDKPLLGQRRVWGLKKRTVIFETPGLPLIAITKLFIGSILLALSLVLFAFHRLALTEKKQAK